MISWADVKPIIAAVVSVAVVATAFEQMRNQIQEAETEIRELNKKHAEDVRNIREAIEVINAYVRAAEDTRRTWESNQRALCAAGRADRVYCESIGNTWRRRSGEETE